MSDAPLIDPPDISTQTIQTLAKTNALIRTATEAANIALWSTCPSTGESWYSDTWFTLLGYQPGDFEPSAHVFSELMHPSDRAGFREAFEALLRDETEIYRAEFRLKKKDGTWCWIGATGSKVVPKDGSTEYVYGMQFDISLQKHFEDELFQIAKEAKDAKDRLDHLATSAPGALFEVSWKPDEVPCLTYATNDFFDLTHTSQTEIEQDIGGLIRCIHASDRARFLKEIVHSRAKLRKLRSRIRVMHPDAEPGYTWIQVQSMPHRIAGHGVVWYGSIYDASADVEQETALFRAKNEAVKAQNEMRHLALHDALTGLPNRRHFDQLLDVAGEFEDIAERATVLIRIDLDRFKFVNDTLGHEAGDAVLVHVARILNQSIASGDTAARVGGDEFCILLAHGKTIEDGIQIVETIQDHLSVPFYFEDQACRFGASFGIASSAQENVTTIDLMSFADAALYRAKAAGRGRLEVFSNKLHFEILRLRALTSDIEAALVRDEFEPFFQPQLCARTGALLGAEVLARWRHPKQGIIASNEFMEVAQQIRAVPTIDKLMLSKAARVIEEWRSNGFSLKKVSFNISPGRLRDTEVVDDTKQLQVIGPKVGFELLESVLLEGDGILKHNLDLAREAGVGIEIDDFGTGHASILGLVVAKPDTLKIDRRLTANVVDNRQGQELVRSIVQIARSLNISVSAEGVENAEQASVLTKLGCDILQGFLFSPPLDANSFGAWVVQNGFSSAA